MKQEPTDMYSSELRSTKIDMRGRKKQVVMIRCGGSLKDVLD